jgi:hypothetical protein
VTVVSLVMLWQTPWWVRGWGLGTGVEVRIFDFTRADLIHLWQAAHFAFALPYAL